MSRLAIDDSLDVERVSLITARLDRLKVKNAENVVDELVRIGYRQGYREGLVDGPQPRRRRWWRRRRQIEP